MKSGEVPVRARLLQGPEALGGVRGQRGPHRPRGRAESPRERGVCARDLAHFPAEARRGGTPAAERPAWDRAAPSGRQKRIFKSVYVRWCGENV